MRQVHAANRDRQLTLDELREMIADGRASGISEKSVEEIFAEALELAAKTRKGRT